jgi:hypothetical protein
LDKVITLRAGVDDLPAEDVLIELLGSLQVIDGNLEVADGVSYGSPPGRCAPFDTLGFQTVRLSIIRILPALGVEG